MTKILLHAPLCYRGLYLGNCLIPFLGCFWSVTSVIILTVDMKNDPARWPGFSVCGGWWGRVIRIILPLHLYTVYHRSDIRIFTYTCLTHPARPQDIVYHRPNNIWALKTRLEVVNLRFVRNASNWYNRKVCQSSFAVQESLAGS